MGYPFAVKFASFLQRKGVQVSSVHKIDMNAAMSKHLEPALLTLLGRKIEFVNLRSEEYTASSRIPQIEFGTPLQDALRRDTTINSLFYNVHTRSVEDQTDKGIPDLEAGIIRTPLAARETFLDDPLRVLRCIRFSSRLGFALDQDVRAAAADSEIQQALMVKVSRERVGVEVEKMISGRDPATAVSLIHDLSLYNTIFTIPPSIGLSQTPSPPISAVVATALLQNLLDTPSGLPSSLPPIHPSLLNHVRETSGVKNRLFLGAAVAPFKGATYVLKKKTTPAAHAAIWEGLRLGSQGHYLDGVPMLYEGAALLREPRLDRFTAPSERVALGLLLRNKAVHNAETGTLWQSSILFSLLHELVECFDVDKNELDVQRASLIVETYTALVSRIEELGLASTIDAKPLLDGTAICKLLDNRRPGPWLTGAMARALEWQLDHPQADSAACAAWLAEEWKSGRLALDDPPPSKRAKADPGSPTKKPRTG
ncbi:transfer RNA nucleotidyltransferase [Auricularia subglabra TFB-10046 SS5]|nr:transfer RNA nucleotidyltransferase [Auricularia subglabra TFB-10046 SS5]